MGTDFGFMNPGGIRADLDQGAITWGEAFNIQPFGNSLVTMNMTGQQIKDVLEQQWSGSYPKMLQISGLNYTWDKAAPIGQRIGEITDANGNQLNPEQIYSVVVNNFVATGGDGFTVFKEGINLVTGPTDLDALVEYIENYEGSISAPELDRIEVR